MSNKNKQVLPCLINLSSIYLYNILFVIENTNQCKRNKIFSFELLSLCGHYWTLYGTLFSRGAFPIFWISHHCCMMCSPPDCLKQRWCIGMPFVGQPFRKNNSIPQHSLVTIYKSFVRPHLDYGDIIYDQPNNESFP